MALSEASRQVVSPVGCHPLAGGGQMGVLVRQRDWACTPVGPIDRWPQSLRTAVSICLESSFLMLIWWGPELVKIYNDAYIPILGSKHPRALGQRGQECWPEIWDIIGPMLNGVLSAGEATWSDDQLLMLERNGYVEECYFTFSYSPIRDESGGVGGVFTAVTETTGRVLGERRLQTLRELAAHAGDARSAEDAITAACNSLRQNRNDIPFALCYLLDADGRRARLAGCSALKPGSVASPLEIDLGGEQPASEVWPLSRCAATGEAVLVEDLVVRFPFVEDLALGDAAAALVLPVRQSGQHQPYGFLVAGVSRHRALDHDYQSFVHLVTDYLGQAITNARTYEAERQRAEALAELDRAKTAFFSNVSHELRTPLTLQLAPLEDVLAAPPTDALAAHHERLAVVHRSSLRLLKLVNTLLDFARLEAGRIQANYEPTDLSAVTVELASVFRSAIERAGLTLRVDCPPLGEPVYVDREMWEKITLNLLSNALKFTFAGEIAVSLRRDGARVELEVRDTGTGIPAEELPHLFERFYRVRGARARTHEGTGIGLALVQELARLHGGEVRVESTVGRGTRFTVALPLGSGHLPQERLGGAPTLSSTATGAAPYVEEALRWLPGCDVAGDATVAQDLGGQRLGAYGETEHKTAAQPARILLADDNADMRDYLARLLGRWWTVETVADGEAALAAARRQRPDLLLTDVMMPGLDGFQLLAAIRADAELRALPVIMLSARAGEEATVEGLAAGADDYLMKPFTARELVARVRAHLEMARVRQETAEQLRQALRLRNQTLSNVSHDLKSPLTTLKGLAQILVRHAGRPEAPDRATVAALAGRIVDSAQAMTEMIGMLEDAALLEVGHPLQLRLAPTDLLSLVREEVERLGGAPAQRRLRIEAALPALPILGDPARLRRVVANLLSNALKFSAEGTEVVAAVRGETGVDGHWAVLEVRDHGIGIPQAELQRVFERFHRGSNVADTISGTGIGLASARQIVEQHGGRITVDSREGVGSTFTVRLPAQSAMSVTSPVSRPASASAPCAP